MTTLILAALVAAAAPQPKPTAPQMDQKRIHHDYNEGNFESVIREIEEFQNSRSTYPLEDSIFIAKHLAVVYSANPDTREKGKYYMFRLLEMLPSAKLVDMYVSDEIDRIFEKVREEFVVRQKGFGVDTLETLPRRAPVNDPGSGIAASAAADSAGAAAEARPANRSRGHKAIWIASGVAAATVGLATVYFLASSEPKKEDKVYEVP